MGVSENLKRGAAELVLLSLLSRQDMYGYELAQTLRERSGGRFVLVETSMYPILYRLEDSGYISSHQEKVGKRRTRNYYHLEPAGYDYYRACLAEYLSAQAGIRGILGDHMAGEENLHDADADQP